MAGRGLGAELRSIRESNQLTTRKVAERLKWPQSRISKIETGKQRITSADVSALLAIYGVTGDERDQLINKAERVDDLGLVESRDGLSRESRTLIQLESEATAILNLELLLVPGLLQTPEYTRALMKSGGVPDSDIELRVVTRMGRQALLSRDTPPRLEFVVDEVTFRRPLLPNRLMARQLRHIVEATERPNLTIQVLPLALGGHCGLDGSFTFFDVAKQKPVVFLDHKITGVFLEAEHEIAFYRREINKLKETAMAPEESVALITALAKQYDQE